MFGILFFPPPLLIEAISLDALLWFWTSESLQESAHWFRQTGSAIAPHTSTFLVSSGSFKALKRLCLLANDFLDLL